MAAFKIFEKIDALKNARELTDKIFKLALEGFERGGNELRSVSSENEMIPNNPNNLEH